MMENVLDALKLTRKLLSFNTINPSSREDPCIRYVGRLLEIEGFKTEYYAFSEGRSSLIARLEGQGDKPPICFTGHIDTVPLGRKKWEKDPFGGELDQNKLYGRGSSDMKGGVAAMVLAAITLAKTRNRKAGISLIITAGEETGCQGAYHLAKLGHVLGKAGAIVVGEPTSNYPFIGHKGALWMKARISGVTAHGSIPDQGVNAIYKAMSVVQKLERFQFNVPPHPLLGLPTLNVGTIEGGMNMNSVPDQVEIGIDIRTIPDQRHQAVFGALERYLGEEVSLERIVDIEGISTAPENEWVNQVFDIMATYLGERPGAQGISYFTDGSVLTPAFGNAPTIIMGPGELEMAHKKDEYCYIDKIKEAQEAYIEIAQNWCEN